MSQLQHTGHNNIDRFMSILSGQATTENVKLKEDLVNRLWNDDKFFSILIQVMMNSVAPSFQPKQLFIARQNAANMINRLIKNRINYSISNNNKSAIFQLIHNFFHISLLSWTVPFNVKKLLFSAFQESLEHWKTELNYFWEDTVESFMRLLQLAWAINNNANERGHFQQIITPSIYSEPIAVTLNLPVDFREVYMTLIFILECMLDSFSLQTGAYQQRIIEIIKSIHVQILKQDFIWNHGEVIARLLQMESDLFHRVMDLERQFQPSFFAITNWDELPQQMQHIIFMKAVPFNEMEGCYNLFYLSQNWEHSAPLLQIKSIAVQVLNAYMVLYAMHDDIMVGSPKEKIIKTIANSIFHSILWLKSQCKGPSEGQQFLDVAFLNFITSFINSCHTTLAFRKQILLTIALPIIKQEIQKYITDFAGNSVQLLRTLIDCCYNQSKQTRLSICCKIVEELVDKGIDKGEDLAGYIKSFIFAYLALQSKESITDIPTDIFEEIKDNNILSVQTSFLILSVLQYTKNNAQYEQAIIRQLLTQETFLSYNCSQKQYFYFYLSIVWQILFTSNKLGNCIFTYPFAKECEEDVKIFALDFIDDNCDHYYFECFTRLFMDKFAKIKYQEIKCLILSKTLHKHLDHFSEYGLCKLIDMLVNTSRQLISKQKHQISGKKDQRTYDIMRYMNICRQISREHEYLRLNPAVIRSLLETLSLIQDLSSLSIDDEVICIGSQLLCCLKRFTQGFNDILETVCRLFQGSEYNGLCYYFFFGQTLQVLNGYDYDTHKDFMDQMINAVYMALIEAFVYLESYPDELNQQHLQSISSVTILLQNIYILFGDKLESACIQETISTCFQLQGRLSKLKEFIQVARIQNLILLCHIVSDQKYPLEDILNLARSGYYCSRRDSIILIYLLNQIYIDAKLTQKDHYTIIAIILYLLRQLKKTKQSKDVRRHNQIAKYNKIFGYATFAIELPVNQLHQAQIFFKEYKRDYARSEEILAGIKKIMDKDLVSFLEQAEKEYDNNNNKFENLGLSLSSSQQQQEEEKIDKGEAEAGAGLDKKTEMIQSKRKFVKVVGDKNGESNFVNLGPTTRKRQMMMIDEKEFETMQKRRKIEPFLSHTAEKIPKREMLMNKMNKRSTRI